MLVSIVLISIMFLALSVGISTVLPVIGRLAILCTVLISGSALFLSIFDASYGLVEIILIVDSILALAWICFAVLAVLAQLARQGHKEPDDSNSE